MKVAFVYDRVNKWGGAERLLLALHEIFPDAPLYTSVYKPKKASWAKVFTVKTSFLQRVPFASTFHECYALFMPLAFESFTFDEFDLVISVTSESAKGIITKPATVHICYCLTPTRYLWSGHKEYFRNFFVRIIGMPFVRYLRWYDKISAQRPDAYLAISHEVQKRIHTYYQRDAKVVYPPSLLADYKKESKGPLVKRNNSFLVVSRLVPYKRIDLAIEACNTLKLSLTIVGTGRSGKYLRSIAGPTITFLGNLTDKELVGYYKGCAGLIFPGYEDFGLTILEAIQFGCMVIAFAKGGALEIIEEGKTGFFFHEQTGESLIETLQKYMQMQFTPVYNTKQREKFSLHHFKQSFLASVEKIVKQQIV